MHPIIKMALEEDIGRGDLSALAVEAHTRARAKIIAKCDGVVSGLWLIPEILQPFSLKFEICLQDGDSIAHGQVILNLEGNARDILSAERTLLNFLQRFSGIASMAAKYRKAISHLDSLRPGFRILDTRKTTPGFRDWEKKAVVHGGCANHRRSLDAGILLKENHLRAAGGIVAAISRMKLSAPAKMPIEVEVTNLVEAKECLALGIQHLLLDNFSLKDLQQAVVQLREISPQVYLEASGGVNLDTIAAIASTGVDSVSVGALTHSAPAADLSLLFFVEA